MANAFLSLVAPAGLICLIPLLIAATAFGRDAPGLPPRPWVIAHRGASAYAPENTLPAFERAIAQGATYIEFDLRRARDGQILCLHDETLERTTNVAAVFPERFRESKDKQGRLIRRWHLEDFTAAEIAQLDAGAWVAPEFAGTRIPTFVETIDAVRGRCGLFIEVKSPEKYPGIERQILEILREKGLDRPAADAKTPVLLQSFSADCLKVFTQDLQTPLPVHFLFGADTAAEWLTPDGLARIRTFATGLSPHKSVLAEHPAGIARAREMGLPITPWTFRTDRDASADQLRLEMRRFVEELGADGVITDNPDLAPSR